MAKNDDNSFIKANAAYVAGVFAVALAIMLALKFASRDVDFCKALFRELVNAKPKVAEKIDWEQLKAVGRDVGAEYRLFRLDKDRDDYKANFISGFAQGFRMSGGSFAAFTRWRVVDKDEEALTVAADYPLKSKTLLFVVPAEGEKKLLALNWSDEKTPSEKAVP